MTILQANRGPYGIRTRAAAVRGRRAPVRLQGFCLHWSGMVNSAPPPRRAEPNGRRGTPNRFGRGSTASPRCSSSVLHRARGRLSPRTYESIRRDPSRAVLGFLLGARAGIQDQSDRLEQHSWPEHLVEAVSNRSSSRIRERDHHRGRSRTLPGRSSVCSATSLASRRSQAQRKRGALDRGRRRSTRP